MSQTETIIFDGYQLAQDKQERLKPKVKKLKQAGTDIRVAAIVFKEDRGSQIYTQAKQETAQEVGIEYNPYWFSISSDLKAMLAKIADLNRNSEVTGIIIQKPWRKTWAKYNLDQAASYQKTKRQFNHWWQKLVASLSPKKDVDGLHPSTLAGIKQGQLDSQMMVMPATARAVISILDAANEEIKNQNLRQVNKPGFGWRSKRILILGRSDLVAKPLFYQFKNQEIEVEMIGRQGFQTKNEQESKLKEYQIIISATGQSKLITGDMINKGVVVIDVGEPRPDVDFDSVKPKAKFITPVPGGVGPVTVISLMENAFDLAFGCHTG
jgi:methylenetetrahydrofolate dehydrogenase (NADP+)/methenyltetrahydrofolate cyclohydrolase